MTRKEALKWLRTFRGRYGINELEDAVEMAIKALESKDALEEIIAEIAQLPTNTRTNWNGCCPDIDYPQIEYVDVTKDKLLSIIEKYMSESEDKDEADD